MPDNRFTSPGVDTRFPSPGTDTRFSAPGTDNRFPSPGTDARFEDLAGFSTALTGLSSDSLGSYARIGNEAGISYSITPDNGTDTVAWDDNSPNAGSDYGTGANPTSLAALSGSTLYCHVTDGGDTVTKAVGVRYAPGSAAGALPDQNGWQVGVAITTVDPTGDFTLTDLTGAWSASGLPAGVSINSGTGAITGTPTGAGSGSITVTFTDQYGRTVSSGFSYAVAAGNTAPVITGVPSISGSAVEGQTLTASPASVAGSPTPTRTWQWYRNTTAISGATAINYTVQAADIGSTIKVRQTETNIVDTDFAESAATAAVTGWQITLTGVSFNGTDTISMTVNRPGTVYYMITNNATETAAAIIAGTGAIDSGSFAVTSGVNNGNIDYPNVTAGDHYLHIVADAATSPSPSAVDSGQYTFPSGDTTAPTLSSPTDAANGQTASTGSVSTDEGNGTLYWVVTTSATAPSAAQVKLGQDNTGTAATASGSQAVSATGVQNITPSGLTASTAYTTHFMHEDTASNQSAVASASGFTTSAAATVPAAMVDANWSVVTGSNPGEIDFTVASAPSNGGSAITKYQYTTDGGTNWRDSGLTALGTVALSLQSDGSAMANGTNYDFEARAVNAVGNAPASNTESATSGAAAGNPELFPDAGVDNPSDWYPPTGCTIQNSAAEWRTAGAFNLLRNAAPTGSMAPVSGSTSYTVGVSVANFVSGGNFQLGVSWFDSSNVEISTDEAAVDVNGNGFFSRVLSNSPANAAYASFNAKPWGANYNLDFAAVSLKAT